MRLKLNPCLLIRYKFLYMVMWGKYDKYSNSNTRSFNSKTLKLVGPVKREKTLFFREKPGFCKVPIFWVVLDLHNLSKSCGPVSNFCFTTCSNFKLTTSEICQTERTIKTKANLTTLDARILQGLQLPSKLRTFPSAGLEVVKKSLWICMAFQKSAFQM